MRGMNQVDLAEASGVAQNTISEIELGKREARPGTLKKLAGALGVEISDLLSEETDRPLGEAPQPSLEDAAQSEAFQEALALQFRRLAERGRRIVERSRKHGPSEALTRELHEYQAVRKTLLEIKKTPSIYGHDSDELAEAEEAYLEVNSTIFGMTRQDVEASEEERRDIRRFKGDSKDREIEERRADAS
jgi:transcriptional regulator with XRE-family HTH domain